MYKLKLYKKNVDFGILVPIPPVLQNEKNEDLTNLFRNLAIFLFEVVEYVTK